jgi:hypothetical protein
MGLEGREGEGGCVVDELCERGFFGCAGGPAGAEIRVFVGVGKPEAP